MTKMMKTLACTALFLWAFVGGTFGAPGSPGEALSFQGRRASLVQWGPRVSCNPFGISPSLTKHELEHLVESFEHVQCVREPGVLDTEMWRVDITSGRDNYEHWLIRFTRVGQVCTVELGYPFAGGEDVVEGYRSRLTTEVWYSGMNPSEVSEVLGLEVALRKGYGVELFKYVDGSTNPPGRIGLFFSDGRLCAIAAIYRSAK